VAQHHRLLDDATCHRAPAARSLRVLIVDDDPVCGELFSLLLTAWEMKCASLRTG
jgi:CheY-like chemotaxis protein